MANELDRELRDWADNAMRPKEPVEPVHHADCTIYACHRLCDVKWTFVMHEVGANLRWVVDELNAGHANPEQVIREGRDD